MTPTIVVARRNLLQVAVLMTGATGKEGSNRRRVYGFVAQWPGLHQRDIARRLDMSAQNAEHHLHHLVRAGLLTAAREGQYVRYYVRVQGTETPTGAVGRDAIKKLGVLRKARPLEIVARLLTSEHVQMGALAAALGISAGTLTHHVKKLEAAGLVVRTQQGRDRYVALADREATIELLLAYEPPADLVAGFQSLWDEVGI